MTVFDDALALEITIGKITWEPNTNLAYSQVVGNFTSSVPIRAEQRSKLAVIFDKEKWKILRSITK